jgi:chromosome segregation ATPase
MRMTQLEKMLEQYVQERSELQDELLRLTQKLSSTKRGKGKIRRSIRKIKSALRKIERLIKQTQRKVTKEGKTEVQQTLANQGIDSRANQIQGIASITGEVAKGVSSVMGGVGASALTQQTRNETSDENLKKGINPLFIVGGLGLVAFMMMKKK